MDGPDSKPVLVGPSLYELLGVDPACTSDELRAAYHQRAREHHPDVAVPRAAETGNTSLLMAQVNGAWRILGNPTRRQEYDASLAAPNTATPQPPPQARRSRREAWVAGVQAQIVRLSSLAGRSSVQALLLRAPRAERAVYDELVQLIVDGLSADTEARVRAARAAGAAPLDLGVAATLIGIRSLSDRTRRQSSLGLTNELMMTAELLDRMWDVLAHELPLSLTTSLGGNPHVAKAVAAN